MSRINDYKRKKAGYDNLDNIEPYENVGVSDVCNMTKYTIRLKTYGSHPECSWFFSAICKHWDAIKKTMKEAGAADVNKTKGEAAKEAGDFLGLVNTAKMM